MLIKDIIEVIEQFAPTSLQESYDNTGLQVGDDTQKCTGVLLCVDVTPEIVEEANKLGCNLIISHHPLFFKEIKHITGKTPIERSAMIALRNGIAIYSAHTSIDSATHGISIEMAKMLSLEKIKILDPHNDNILKLSLWCPDSHAPIIQNKLFEIGCGKFGNYDNCCFISEGIGTFKPGPESNPFMGEHNKLHSGKEKKIEMLLPMWLRKEAETVIKTHHPYEEPAFEFSNVKTGMRKTGFGAIGKFRNPLKVDDFIKVIKNTFNSPIVRTTEFPAKKYIQTVALCGGSGSFLIDKAIRNGADAFITSDTKYHDFVNYTRKILIADIGHYESESCCKNIFYRIITEKFHNFAVYFSKTESNPIIYR